MTHQAKGFENAKPRVCFHFKGIRRVLHHETCQAESHFEPRLAGTQFARQDSLLLANLRNSSK